MAQRVRGAPEPAPSSGALVDEADIELVGHPDDDQAPMDKLLAETDEGWDVEEQRLTLKQTAATMPRQSVSDVAPAESTPGVPRAVPVPTAFDLAPTRVPD